MSIVIRNRLDPDNLSPGITILVGLGAISITGRTASLSIASTSTTETPGVGAITMAGKIPTLAINPTTTGTQWFVRPNGGTYGAENGTDWNNAFDGFSDLSASWASIQPGDTIWVAGGTYSQDFSITGDGASGNPIYIRRARSDASACTTASGWSSSFDATVLMNNHTIDFNGATWVTLSGVTTEGGHDQGWHLNNSAFTGEDYSTTYFNSQNIIVEGIEIEGPGFVNYTGDSRGISLSAAGTATNITFRYVKVHKHTSGIFISNVDNVTFEYCDESDCSAVNASSWHPNGIWAAGCAGLTVRYCYFHQGAEGFGVGEGIFAEQSGGNSNWKIYGNVFANVTKAIQFTSPVPQALIYNNTFFNVGQPQPTFTDTGACGSGSAIKNNLIYQGSGYGTCGTGSNNITATSNPFVDSANGDFHIISTIAANMPRDKGTDLGAPYNVDPDGNTRGADGTWDCGAYEYVP